MSPQTATCNADRVKSSSPAIRGRAFEVASGVAWEAEAPYLKVVLDEDEVLIVD